MSKYLELKSQIEALTAQLEATRVEELETEVIDMKKRITAFGIRPDQLFTKEQLSGARADRPKRNHLPPKFALNGHTWSGMGSPPRWYREALKAGKSADDMLIKPAQ